MSYGGHVIDALNRMKHNRSLKPSKKEKFKANVREPINSGNGVSYNPKNFSEKEVQKAKQQIFVNTRKERKIDILIYSCVILIVIVLLAVAYIRLKSY